MMMSKMEKVIKKRGAFLAFCISFIIHLICNFFVPIMHFVPDELGAITAAAQMAGYGWEAFWAENQVYYGVVFGTIFTPFFLFIKNPFVLYQCMLAIVAFFHSLIAPISFLMMTKYCKLDKNTLVFVGAIGCSFLTAWRSTNVMNETPLLICVWLVSYLLLSLQICENKKKKIINTVYLIVVLSFSYLSHTRGLIVIIATLLTVIVYFCVRKKSLVHGPTFVGLGLVTIMLTRKIISFIEIKFYAKNINGNLHNSLESMGEVLRVDSGGARRLSIQGLAGFLDMLCGNLYAIFLITFGLAFLGIIIVLRKYIKYAVSLVTKKNVERIDNIDFAGLFCALGLGGSLISYSILNMAYAMAAYDTKTTISYYLYPRYFGIYFGPLFIIIIYAICKEKLSYKFIGCVTLGMYFLVTVYSFIRYIYDCAIKGGDILDAWRVLLPLTFTTQWNKSISFNDFIWCTLLVSLIFLIGIVLCKVSRKKQFVMLMTGLLIYQYVITSIVYDRGISLYCLNLVDQTYELLKDSGISNDISEIYVANEANRRSIYLLQYLFPDKIVHGEPPKNREDNTIVFTTKPIENMEMELYQDYQYVVVDSGEFFEGVLVKGDDICKKLEEAGFSVLSIY